jgi:sec-independent protein translocase protein TatB
MLDFGFSEILLTSAIALVVLGPERLPKVARQVGNWMGRARTMARQLSEQLEREVNAEELLREQNKYKVPVTPQIAAPQPATLDPYAHLPAHDPIPPRSPLPPEVVAASAAVDGSPPTADMSSAALVEAPIPVAPITAPPIEAPPTTLAPSAEPSATAAAHSADTVKPPHE